MLTIQDCVKIGTFHKPWGYSGTLLLRFSPEWEASLEQAERIIVEAEGLPVPWFIAREGIRITASGSALVDLEWTETQESALKLCGCDVYLLKEDAIPPEEVGEPEGWNGYKVADESGQQIGVVIRTENFSGNLVMILETPDGEKMVPLHENLVLEKNSIRRTLRMEIPEGLLEL